MRTISSLGHPEAAIALAAIQKTLEAEKRSAAIAVADVYGELIGFLRIDGASPTVVRIATNKAWTAARERVPTADLGRDIRHPERGFDVAYFGDRRYVGWGGGLPVTIGGQVVGSVAVSGLTEDEDVRLAAIGVDAIQKSG